MSYDVEAKEQVYPVYALPNRSVSPRGPDFRSSLFGSDFGMKVTDKNYLDRQGFSVFSLRQHLPSRFRRSEEHGHGDDSPWGTHRHQR
jgi:hypothetical protein